MGKEYVPGKYTKSAFTTGVTNETILMGKTDKYVCKRENYQKKKLHFTNRESM